MRNEFSWLNVLSFLLQRFWVDLGCILYKTRMQHLMQGIPYFRAFQDIKTLIFVLKEIRITANYSAKKSFRVYSRNSFLWCNSLECKRWSTRSEAERRFSWIRNNHSKVNNVEKNLKEILDYLMDKGVSSIVIHIVEEKGDDV